MTTTTRTVDGVRSGRTPDRSGAISGGDGTSRLPRDPEIGGSWAASSPTAPT
ncbi:hypothetical protein [Streptomyces hokutonensis]|uniref:hypothetical protein n=1 Tax=Streptomyces hokutonensis TaxID=1306990 RepID=UPI00381B7E46